LRLSRLPNVGFVQDPIHLAAMPGSQAFKQLDHGVVGKEDVVLDLIYCFSMQRSR